MFYAKNIKEIKQFITFNLRVSKPLKKDLRAELKPGRHHLATRKWGMRRIVKAKNREPRIKNDVKSKLSPRLLSLGSYLFTPISFSNNLPAPNDR